MLKDITYCDDRTDVNRTKKVYSGIDYACYEFDLSKPIWLDNNIKQFKTFDKTRFYQDSFIESIDFDYLEVHVIEED